MPRKWKFIVPSIMFLGIGLITGFILSMSLISLIAFILFVFVSFFLIIKKGGLKICQFNAK